MRSAVMSYEVLLIDFYLYLTFLCNSSLVRTKQAIRIIEVDPLGRIRKAKWYKTGRPKIKNKKAKFDCKAENIGSVISAQYVDILRGN